MVYGIFLAANWIANDGASILWSIILPGIPLLMVVVVTNHFKYSLFTYAIIRITSDNYCLITRNITWRSYFQIMYAPSHFNDLENGEAEETYPNVESDRRIPDLRARVSFVFFYKCKVLVQIKTRQIDNSTTKKYIYLARFSEFCIGLS
eukprot:g6212.t2